MPDDRLAPSVPGVTLQPRDLVFTFTRSSGPGGQNVNKLATRAVLTVSWDALEAAMPAPALTRLRAIANQHATDAGLLITDQSSRSQYTNRRHCIQRLETLLKSAMHRPKTRRPTRPTQASKRRRLDAKKHRGKVKASRQRPRGEE